MSSQMDRLTFIKALGIGGAVFATGLPGFAETLGSPAQAKASDFYFVQLTDTHWGFEGAKANPDATGTLPKAIDAVNALDPQPDFVIFTGDLTHITTDPAQRRKRMAEFKAQAARLRAPQIRYLPGEHDAGDDHSEAFREAFGPSRYAFTHKGIHFIALDNVSQEGSILGEEQLRWFAAELDRVPKEAPLVIFTHRPLFDLYPDWDWTTTDGAKALDLMKAHRFVTVFYGHIHQEHHHTTGHIQHHAATSLIFPLPAPGSVPKRAPVPWDPEHPYRGLGFRQIHAQPKHVKEDQLALSEKALADSLKTAGTHA
ncbi:serine/threonine protein phosphatase [Geothrix limicola]|uniref:Serine/threonine protein phosphatase n=1 Tax=Geothrix limicola TaxID=2927978 RepID=A0ABQ5QI16_9BACT|nr:metallophosphoesterase [Geothrix limicola]GLH74333.1 serine/threonine protein phosphatase [Geothrix limicola]